MKKDEVRKLYEEFKNKNKDLFLTGIPKWERKLE